MTIKMRNCGGASVSIGDDREKPKMGVDWKTETIRQIFLEVLDDPRESEEKLTGIKLLFKYKKEEEISDTPLELVHVNMCGDIELDFHTINMDECLDDDDNRMKTQDCINSMIKVEGIFSRYAKIRSSFCQRSLSAIHFSAKTPSLAAMLNLPEFSFG